jgi:hypothetical protein
MSIFTLSCEKEDEKVVAPEKATIEATISDVLINEVCSHAFIENEFGDKSDWIELYNNTESEILLKDGDWSISDNPAKSDKFMLPECTIPSNGHLLIWCDKSKETGDDIHASFKIFSKGETLILYHKGDVSDEIQIDSLISDDNSYARINDGSQEWIATENATPNDSNE